MGRVKQDLFPLALFGGLLVVTLIAMLVVEQSGDSRTIFSSKEAVVGQSISTGGTYDVTYVKQVLSWKDIGWVTYALKGETFAHSQWLSGGYFVVTGWCDVSDGNSKGMYLLDASGTYLGRRNVCADTDWTGASCPEGGGCQLATQIQEIDGTTFVRDTSASDTGANRAPVIYSASASGIALVSKAYTGTHDDSSTENIVSTTAVANGKIVGVAYNHNGPGQGSAKSNVIYSAPPFSLLASPASGTSPIAYPVIGIGDYLITTDSTVGATGHTGTSVFKLSGTTLTFVQQLSPLTVNFVKRDPLNPNRVLVCTSANGPSQPGSCDTYLFSATGVTHEKTITPIKKPTGTIAIAGDYIAYGTCPAIHSDGSIDFALTDCGLVVQKNDQLLSVQQINPAQDLQPLTGMVQNENLDSTGVMYVDVSISPTGKILALPDEGKSLHRMFMFQIQNFAAAPPSDPNAGSPPSSTTPPGYAPPIDPITNERYLTLSAGTAPTCTAAGGFCASTAPTNSMALGGTCASGACYVCNGGYTYQNGACVSTTAATCAANGGFCATTAPANSQTLTGSCTSGACYVCATGYSYQNGQCVASSACNECTTLNATQCTPHGGGTNDSVRVCELVNGCQRWSTPHACGTGGCQNNACSPVATGSGQNIKIIDIRSYPGYIGVSFCKTVQDGIMMGNNFTVIVSGDKTYTQNTMLGGVVPYCYQTMYNYSQNTYTNTFLFNNPVIGQSKTVTATAQFPPQFNNNTADDTMTKTVTIQ